MRDIVGSDAAFLLFELLLALLIAWCLIYWQVSRRNLSALPKILVLVMLTPPLAAVVFTLAELLPNSDYNAFGYKALLLLFVLLVMILYRMALPAVVRRHGEPSHLTRVGIVALSLSAAIFFAYTIANRPPRSFNPFSDLATAEIESGRFLMKGQIYPGLHAVQFILSVPNGLGVDESGLAYVSFFERTGEGGKARIWPRGYIHPQLVAPDYQMYSVEAGSHSTTFLADESPKDPKDADEITASTVWSWVIRPQRAGHHVVVLRLLYSAKPQDRPHSSADLIPVKYSAYLLRQVFTYGHGQRDEMHYINGYTDFGLSHKWDVVAETDPLIVNVPSPFILLITPWLAAMSALAGLLSIFLGMRRKAGAS